jgi:putative hemolysin
MFPGPVATEASLILALILLNGFFAAAEIAVVSSRRGALKQMEEKGRTAAGLVARWLKEPERFLATVQIGITLVGVLGSVVGGAAAIRYLKPLVQSVPALAPWAEPLSLGSVVLVITYLSLVLGELVPKSLALLYRERLALFVAWPIHWLSRAVRPVVAVLTASTRTVLFLIGRRDAPKDVFVSEDEIRFLVSEGGRQGVFDQTEQQLIPKVFDFAETKVRDLMVGRDKVVAADLSTPKEKLLVKVAEEGFTRLPVYQGDLDHVVGILHMKDLIHVLTLGGVVVLQDLIRPAVFIPETAAAKDLLLLFQKRRIHMAVVQDAASRTVGVVTLEDLLEKIVGDIRDEHDTAP